MNEQSTARVRGWPTLTFSPDGKRLVSTAGVALFGGPAKPDQPRVWDATTGQQLFTLKGHTELVQGVAWSHDGKQLASASHDHTVKLWDAANGKEIRTLKGHRGFVGCVAFRPDGRQLASSGADPMIVEILLWDAATGQEVRTLKGPQGLVHRLAFSPDGRRLASASEDPTVRIWAHLEDLRCG